VRKFLKDLYCSFTITSGIIGCNLLILSPVLAGTNYPLVSNLERTTLPNNPNLKHKNQYISQPPALEEIYNVHQLRDIAPNDWAYEALRNLVERYRCISGFPDTSFRGNKTMSRHEFATALNTCLLKISHLIDNNASLLEDLQVIKRLQAEFAAEIQMITGRLDKLENQVAFAENHQFSTTTVLRGAVDFNLSNAFGQDKAVLPGNNPGPKLNTQLALSARAITTLDTSFTGRDKLRIVLQEGNVNNLGYRVTGTDMTLLAGSTNTTGKFKTSTIFYQFPLGNSAIVALAPAADFPTRVFPVLNPVFSISNFGSQSPVHSYASGAGGVVYYNITNELSAGVSYLTATAQNVEQGVNGQYSILTQITYTPTKKLGLAFTYGRYYAPSPLRTVNVTGSEGSQYAEYPFGANTPTSSNDFGVQFTYKFTNQLTVGGWISYFNPTSQGSPTVSGVNGLQGATADIWSCALTASLIDLGKLGTQLSFIVGMPPKVTRNDILSRQDQDTPLHFELSYRYPLNDHIFITPGFILILNPESNSANPSIGIGLVRTTFTF